ncbi:hypothetical protein JTE90_027194 [Oedothorax gibbosus]|uniref:Large ribosomal subunit protein mL38 n=1 Tax=Oedothorax gibbosus TaxID=931172 RepID=A0AAV6U595_9ARAC|nr:hypothetical protein JTE90_027194 [Oedothorax gibbosus]
MSAVYAAGKTVKNGITRKYIKDIFLTTTRNKDSRWLGYYKKKLSTPVYRAREAFYRENVLMPLEEIPSLEQRLKELNAPDPVIDKNINIGFVKAKGDGVTLKDRLLWRKQIKAKKEEVSYREEITKIDLDEVKKNWLETEGPNAIKNVADHYGIFSHLYQHGYFTPYLPLHIAYEYDEEWVTPVCMGNILQASEASKAPSVAFDSKPSDLWTLVLTNLDGHLLDTNSEYLHWFIGNIKGNDLQTGEVLCDYLRPFPMRGTGYHRLVFVLYKQKSKVDFSSIKRTVPCMSLKERTFKTFDFYKRFQDFLTPIGLSFYQCTWDESLTDFFHNVLNMQEPVFEYIEPPLQYRPQVQFPHLEPFNLYLDRYRDPKEIKKEVLLKRLKTIEPFKEEPPMPKYPVLHKPDNYMFSWQKHSMKLERLRLGKFRDLRPHSVYPQEDDQFQTFFKE